MRTESFKLLLLLRHDHLDMHTINVVRLAEPKKIQIRRAEHAERTRPRGPLGSVERLDHAMAT